MTDDDIRSLLKRAFPPRPDRDQRVKSLINQVLDRIEPPTQTMTQCLIIAFRLMGGRAVMPGFVLGLVAAAALGIGLGVQLAQSGTGPGQDLSGIALVQTAMTTSPILSMGTR